MDKIKLIIFDLDGVLVEAKKIHYDTLNDALGVIDDKYTINWDDHLNKFDGLKTNQKLEMLTKERGLPIGLHKEVWDKKQKLTLESLRNLAVDNQLLETISKLSNDGYKIGCCSNSIRKTVLTVLSKLCIIEFFDVILSNEDVKNSLGKRKSKTLLQPMCEWRERVNHKKLWFKEKWRKESGVET